MSNIVRIMKYIDKKRFIRDTKILRQWSVPELKERKRKEKRGERKEEQKTQEKRKKRFHLGTMALWEIRKFQKFIGFLIRKLPCTRWVREVAQIQWGNLRFKVMALLTLQKVAEAYVVNLFKDTNLCEVHAKRVTSVTRIFNWHIGSEGDMVKYL